MAMTLPRIIVFVVLTHTAFGAARVTASLYALSNKASPFTVGVLLALYALVPALLAVRAGRWLDEVGPFRPLLTGNRDEATVRCCRQPSATPPRTSRRCWSQARCWAPDSCTCK